MRTEVLDDVVHRDLEVLEEGDLRTWLVVEGYHLVEDGEVACLLDIGHRTKDEPAGVIIETTTNVVVTTLGEGLVLVIATTIGELRRCDIDDALTSARWNLMEKIRLTRNLWCWNVTSKRFKKG